MKSEQKMIDRTWLDAHRQEWIEDLVRLVSIPSVSQECSAESEKPFGPECARALDLALEMAMADGFQTQCHEYYCGTAYLPGTEAECGDIGVFVHLDVVPPGGGWNYPPFAGIVKDGFVIARGSRDNKGAAVAVLYAVRAMRDKGICLRHGLRFFFGCNEELGMEDIVYYLKTAKPPVFSLVPDSPFPVCYGEKGVIDAEVTGTPKGEGRRILSLKSGVASNQVPESAEAWIAPKGGWDPPLTDGISVSEENGMFWIVARGRAAHSAYPEGSDNAAVKLAAYLADSGALSETEANWMRFVKEAFSDHYGENLGISGQDETGEPLTCVPGMMTVTEEGFWCSVNIRYPQGMKGEEICGKLREAVEKAGLSLEKESDNPGYCMDRSHPAIDLLNEIACRKLGIEGVPYVAKGGTYARRIPGPAVGYGPNCPGPHPFGPGKGTGHLPDEAISIQGVEAAMEVYAEALQALDKLLR